MVELIAAIYIGILGIISYSTPNQYEVCEAMVKNNLIGSDVESRRFCETTIEMTQNIKACDLTSCLLDFNDCIDKTTQAMMHDWDSPEVKAFIEKLSNDAKKEHKG